MCRPFEVGKLVASHVIENVLGGLQMIERVTAAIRHLILILTSATFVQASFAGASRCEHLLGAGQISARERTTSLSTSEDLRNFQSLTFDVVGSQTGKHGGKRLIVKRKGPWFDLKDEIDEKVGDVVPDLRANIFLLGENGLAGMIDQIGAFGSLFLNPEARIFFGKIGNQQYYAVADDPKWKRIFPIC
jgi:hypothetical protein